MSRSAGAEYPSAGGVLPDMRLPIVTEIVQPREPVVRDTFIADLHVRSAPSVPPRESRGGG